MSNDINFDDLVSFEGLDLPGFKEEAPQYEPLVLQNVVSNPSNRTVDVDADYAYVRQALHHQSQMIMDMAQVSLAAAKTAESPRHVEVFATLMSQMTTNAKELLKVHREMREIKPDGAGGNEQAAVMGSIEGKAQFLSSPEDLIDMMQREEENGRS